MRNKVEDKPFDCFVDKKNDFVVNGLAESLIHLSGDRKDADYINWLVN